MAAQTRYITPDIKLSWYGDRMFKADVLFEDHLLVWFLSGGTKLIQADARYEFGAGDIFLIPRHALSTVINYPVDGRPHQSVVMHLTSDRLRGFYAGVEPVTRALTPQRIHTFGRHPLLESCLASLMPYFDVADPFPERIAALKIAEAINILRLVDPAVDGILGTFEEPGKIDLAEFMEKHFMFNMPLERFGYLTGRSLSTFHRDFKKRYAVSPEKWLTRKRLDLAYYRIRESGQKPSEVYLEVGFEDLSHFSYAFKRHFGVNPSAVYRGGGGEKLIGTTTRDG